VGACNVQPPFTVAREGLAAAKRGRELLICGAGTHLSDLEAHSSIEGVLQQNSSFWLVHCQT